MSTRIRNYIRSNVLGLVAIYIALTGTAIALPGTNTVDSADIIDNQVKSADVRNDTLGGGGLRAVDLRPDSVGTSEVADDTLTGGGLQMQDLAADSVGRAEVANNSLTGEEIKESTLGQVPSAFAATKANSAYSAFYEERIPLPNSLTDPANPIMTLNVPQAGSYVVLAKLWTANASSGSGFALCRLTAGGDFDETAWDADGNEVGTNMVAHTFGHGESRQVALSCTDNGIGAVGAQDTRITAIQIASLTSIPFVR